MKNATLVAAVAVLAIAFMLVLSGCASLPPVPKLPGGKNGTADAKVQAGVAGMSTFSSWNEVSDFLHAANPNSGYGYAGGRGEMMLNTISAPLAMVTGAAKDTASAPQQAVDYSQTNVQVAGVDEADSVKNDGKYIYTMGSDYYSYGVGPFSYSGSRGRVTIVDAYPAAQMKKVSEITFEGTPEGLFVYEDKLVVFGSRYEAMAYPAERAGAVCLRCTMPPYYSQNFAFMRVYDISDRQNPKLAKEIEVKGSYVTARMIGGKVYAVFSDPASYSDPVPLYAVDGAARKIAPSEVSYFDSPDSNYNYNIFVSLDLKDLGKGETRKVMLMGYAQNLFVSEENVYVTYTRYDYYYPEWEAFYSVYGSYLPSEAKEKIAAIDASNMSDWRKDRMKMADVSEYAQQIAASAGDSVRDSLQEEYYGKLQELQQKRASEAEKTAISRVELDGFSLAAKGEVPGHVLNQFSMDESGGYFRIATTIPQAWGYNGQAVSQSASNVYVLDMGLNRIGGVEGIAPGESIYSVRFMGSRAYMVTFKKIDPFFVIDLSDPAAPRILGKLKLPGYSSYLHPYDGNYVIGLGKGAEPSEQGDFAWYQGVKLSLFDVRDVENPREVANFEIGDRGSSSYALDDHKAFLFSKERNLLVIPVLEAKLDKSKYAGDVPSYAYGDYVFQGAYVFNVTPEGGFVLKGRITHATDEEMMKAGEYYWSNSNVKRALYMDDYLYTVSDQYVKANSLSSLAQISSVQVGSKAQNGYYYGTVTASQAVAPPSK